MRTQLYSIYDSVAEVFNKPFTEFNDKSATRSFKESLNDSKHKEDYHLYHIGEYNDASGEVLPTKVPSKICSGLDIKAVPQSLQKQAG